MSCLPFPCSANWWCCFASCYFKWLLGGSALQILRKQYLPPDLLKTPKKPKRNTGDTDESNRDRTILMETQNAASGI